MAPQQLRPSFGAQVQTGGWERDRKASGTSSSRGMSSGLWPRQERTQVPEPFLQNVYIKNPVKSGVPCPALGLHLTRTLSEFLSTRKANSRQGPSSLTPDRKEEKLKLFSMGGGLVLTLGTDGPS